MDEMTLVETIRALGGRGEAPALLTPDLGRVSYGELAERAERLAGGLLGSGLQPGDHFAFLLPNGSRIVECYLACGIAGLVGVPLSTRATPAELSYQLVDSEAAALLFSADSSGLVTAAGDRGELPEILLSTGQPMGALDYESLLRSASRPGCPEPGPDSHFCLMYTGGTTGRPKAAIQTQRSWAASIRAVAREWGLSENDRHLAVLPMDHVSWFSTVSLLSVGGTIFVDDYWDPQGVLETVEHEEITTLNMIPTMFGDFLEVLATRESPRIPSVRLLTVAGSPMPIEMYQRGLELVGPIMGCIYGMTESSGPVSFLLPADLSVEHLRSGGRPGPGIELAILGEDGQPAGGAGPGEIGLKGPQITAGYLNRPEATREAFSDGWFLTGDIGRVDEQGFLYVVDRSKDMVKSGGFNVYPKEVEDALYSSPEIREAAVVGVPDARWIEAVVAGVVLQPGSSMTDEGLRDYCRGLLPGYKVPKKIHIEQRLPRTKVGKFDKLALRNRYSESADQP